MFSLKLDAGSDLTSEVLFKPLSVSLFETSVVVVEVVLIVVLSSVKSNLTVDVAVSSVFVVLVFVSSLLSYNVFVS